MVWQRIEATYLINSPKQCVIKCDQRNNRHARVTAG